MIQTVRNGNFSVKRRRLVIKTVTPGEVLIELPCLLMDSYITVVYLYDVFYNCPYFQTSHTYYRMQFNYFARDLR